MSGIERDLGFHRGARFIRDGEMVKFSYGIDPNNVIGPREATPADKAEFPGEWRAFEAEKPLDDINHLRAEYTGKFGKRPFMGWDEATLREKLEAG